MVVRVKIAVAMTTFVRGACASLILGLGMVVAGCGGGGSGPSVPGGTGGTGTATPTSPGLGSGAITASQLVFVSNRTGSSELFKANADGSNPVRISNLASTLNQTIEKPSVSPEGTRIVFQYGTSTSGAGTDNLEIGAINSDGSEFQSLTNDSTSAGRPDDYNPVFSPDGRYIYWTSTRTALDSNGQNVQNTPHIFRMLATGAQQTQLITEPSEFPSVARNNSTLAYASRAAGVTAPITIYNLTSNSVTSRIGEGVAVGAVFNVALSPDASRVAFSTVSGSGSSASSSITILGVSSGASQGTLNTGNLFNGGESWSRNSQTLYYGAPGSGGGGIQLFASDAPFSTNRQLTQAAQGSNYSPAFLTGN